MIVEFTKSFEKSLKESPDEERVKKAAEKFILGLETTKKPHGLGLKKLRNNLWEFRVGLNTRVVFALFPGCVRLLLVGNHDKIKTFLKN